jgi:hypothetical protein
MEKIKRTVNDCIYTKPEIAYQLLTNASKYFNEITLFVEPSAGKGAFIDALKKIDSNGKIISMDINPQREDIISKDFFTYECENPSEKTCIIGNLPFSIAKSFLNKCTTVADLICLILPVGLYNNIPKTYLPLNWVILHREILSKNVFENTKKVNTCFMILKKTKNEKRSKFTSGIKPNGYSIITIPTTKRKREEMDIILWQTGGKAGKKITDETSLNKLFSDNNKTSAYGITFNDSALKDKIMKDDNFYVISKEGTNNRKYIASEDIIKKINNM